MRRTRRYGESDLSWDRRSVWWPRAREAAIPGGDSNLWMCAQDIGAEIWAQFDRFQRREEHNDVQSVWVENCSDELCKVLTDCLPFNEYDKDLSGAICEFTMLVAQEFMLEGALLFEVCGGWDCSTDPPRLKKAALESIPRGCIARLGPWAFQVIPPVAENKDSTGHVIRLNRSRLVVFAPPRHWRRTLVRIRTGLPIIGRSEHEWMMGVSEQKIAEAEDFKTVNLAYNIQRARLTAPIGWNSRGRFSDHIADFHWTTRELRWKRFCIEVRDAILTSVGGVFALVGSWSNEHPRLAWDHLPTVEQVREGEERILGTGAPFEEILKPFR